MPSLEELVEDLQHPILDIRQRAVSQLVQSGDVRSIALLVRVASHDPSAQIRFVAKRALMDLRKRAQQSRQDGELSTEGPVGRVVARFQALPVSERIRLIDRIVSRLGRQALPVLTSFIRDEQEPFVRSRLVVALGITGDPSAIPCIERYLSDPDPRVRANAVEALGYIGTPRALPLMARAVAIDDNPRLVQNMRRFLARTGLRPFLAWARVEMESAPSGRRALVTRALERIRSAREVALLKKGLLPNEEAAGIDVSQVAVVPDPSPSPDRPEEPRRPAPAPSQEQPLTPAGTLRALRDLPEEECLEKFARLLASGEPIPLDEMSDWLNSEESPRIRSVLLKGTTRVEGEGAIHLLKGLFDDPDGRVRADAIEALGALTDPSEELEPSIRERLVDMLSDPSGRVRANAVILLSRREVLPEAWKALEDLSRSGETVDRLSALYVIADLARPEGARLAAGMKGDLDAEVRIRATETLEILADQGVPLPSSEKVSEGGEVAPRAESPSTAEAGADEAAGDKEDDGGLPQASDSDIEMERLLFRLESDVPSERMEALCLLEDMGDWRAVGSVARRTNDRVEEVRAQAGRTLRALKWRLSQGGQEPAGEDRLHRGLDPDRLRGQLKHPETTARMEGLRRLSPGDRDAVPVLLECLPGEQDPRVRASMVVKAGIMGGPGTAEALATYLEDPDDRVRANAVEALEYCGDDGVLDVVAHRLVDRSARVVQAARQVFRHFAETAVADVTERLLASTDYRQRVLGIKAMVARSGEDSVEKLYRLLGKERNETVLAALLGELCRAPHPVRPEVFDGLSHRAPYLAEKGHLDEAFEALGSGRVPAGLDRIVREDFAGLQSASTGPEEDAGADVGGDLQEGPSSEAAKDDGGKTSFSSEDEDDPERLERMLLHWCEDLYSSEPRVRQTAATRLAGLETSAAALKALIKALEHPDFVVRFLARQRVRLLVEDTSKLDRIPGAPPVENLELALARAEGAGQLLTVESSAGFPWSAVLPLVLMLPFVLYAIFIREPPPPAEKSGADVSRSDRPSRRFRSTRGTSALSRRRRGRPRRTEGVTAVEREGRHGVSRTEPTTGAEGPSGRGEWSEDRREDRPFSFERLRSREDRERGPGLDEMNRTRRRLGPPEPSSAAEDSPEIDP